MMDSETLGLVVDSKTKSEPDHGFKFKASHITNIAELD